MFIHRIFLTAFLVSVTASLVRADEPPLKSADALPAIEKLPNPFVFLDGSPVRTKEDWARRRTEIKGLFENYEYGHLPPKPEKMCVTRGELKSDEEAKVSRQSLEAKLEHAGKSLDFHVNLTLPLNAKGLLPVVIQGGMIRPNNAAAPATKKRDPRGNRLGIFTDRGYAVAEFDFRDAALDDKVKARTVGVYQLFDDKIDCGALMAWAWGFHRVIDIIETMPAIDPKKVVVTGHSRYGKAALVAGAFDERVALTVPNHSGCAGTAPFRFIYGKSEQIQNIVGFTHWFGPNFNQFVGKVDRLPIDQHLLKALVAPRALLDVEGTQDAWSNPEGAQLTHLAAERVYEFLGVRDRLSIRFRPVGHIVSTEDLLDLADHVFLGKPLPEEFGKLPYPEEKNGFDWAAPP